MIVQVYLGKFVLICERKGIWGEISKELTPFGYYHWLSTQYLTEQEVISTSPQS